MATRRYNAALLVALPPLRAHELLSLARALLAAAKATAELPAAVLDAQADLEAAAAALADALGSRDRKIAAALRDAARAEDDAVGAFVDMCRALQRLPRARYPEQVMVAEACLAVALEDGEPDASAPQPAAAHAEVGRRLDRLGSLGLVGELIAVGMAPFVEHLLASRAAYVEAWEASLAATREEPAEIKPAFAEAIESMREYVVQVVASVSRHRPESQGRADALLDALGAWDTAQAVSPDAPPANDAEAEADVRRWVG